MEAEPAGANREQELKVLRMTRLIEHLHGRLAVVAWLSLAALSASAFRSEERTDTPGGASGARALQATVSRDRTAAQTQTAEAALQAGFEIAWHERLGTPLSVRAADLGKRQVFSGGKGLTLRKGGAFAEDAVAVLDSLSPLYEIKDAAAEFALEKVVPDAKGFHHVRLSQRYGGLRVVGGGLIVHFDNADAAYEVNGQFIPDIAVSTTATVSASAAIKIAQAKQSEVTGSLGELEARPELVVFARNCPPRLAHELTLLVRENRQVTGRWRYWVDAQQGTILSYHNDIKRIDPPVLGELAPVTGSVLPREGGAAKEIIGWREETGNHYLYNNDLHWCILNAAESGWSDAGTFAYRATNDWGTSDRAEISAANNFDLIQKYFRDVHAIDSYDGEGADAYVFVHEGNNYANAFWNGVAMFIGDGDGKTADCLAVLDVCAHEYSHAVTERACNLVYAYESGALNESFSDIFGVCVEFHAQEDDRTNYPVATPGKADWLMGEDCWRSSPALRDMRNPANTVTVGAGGEQPTRYKGTYWYSGAADNGGVHQNSGVQNFFFYLLCEGGSGTNDSLSFGYDVTGIGITNAEQVAYRALSVYFTEDTDYYGARQAWISAALDLNKMWVRSVRQAWNAVLGLPPPPMLSIASPGTLPTGRMGSTYSTTLLAANGLSPYVWQLQPESPLQTGLAFDSATGRISGLPEAAGEVSFAAIVTDLTGESATNQFSLTILPPFAAPYSETFESGAGQLSSGWMQEFVSNAVPWTYVNGNGEVVRNPAAAHGGTNNACMRVTLAAQNNGKTLLVSPRIVFAEPSSHAQLSFWHYMAEKDNIFQDELRVYYKTTYAGEWQPLATYTQSVNTWTRRTVSLPEASATYYIAFGGTAKLGYGVHVDDVEVVDAYVPFAIVAPETLPNAELREPYSYALSAQGGMEPYTYELADGTALPVGLTLGTNGVISGTATNVADLGAHSFSVLLTDGQSNAVTRAFSLTVDLPRVELFVENFDNGGAMPSDWSQVFLTNGIAWACRGGGGNGDTFHQPTNAYEGLYNAVLWADNYSNNVSRLVSPAINLGAAPVNLQLEFWHCMTKLVTQQDELRVYYKTSASGTWTQLASFTSNVTSWTRRVLPLSVPATTTFYLAFEGTARFGQGVCVDAVRITDASLEPIIMTTSPLPDGTVGSEYRHTLQALGGVAPYTWDLVSGTLPSGLVFSAGGVLSGMPEVTADVSLGVRVTDSAGYAATRLLSLHVSNIQRLPYTQTFESRSQVPAGWSQEGSSVNWTIYKGSSLGVPAVAHSGTNNALLVKLNNTTSRTKLVMPTLNMGGVTNAQVSFWLCMAKKTYQDELTVCYKTNAADTVWTTITNFNQSITTWTKFVLDLPNASSTYVIAFEGAVRFGYGVCIDDVSVTGDYAASAYDLWKADVFGADALNEAIAGDLADPDNDGIVNWLEFAMALNPLAHDAGSAMTGGVTAGYLTLSHRENPDASDILFEVEGCSDLSLQDWTTVDVTEVLREYTNTWYWVTTRHDVPVTNAPQRFLRLKVTMPE